MEQLISVLTDYVGEKIDAGTDWYVWSFKTDRVPPGILGEDALPNDWYSINVHLKQRLNRMWMEDSGRREELEHYYISEWGGVRTNNPRTLAAYHQSSVEQNIARGKKGIASWSKALCVRDPQQFAIFDARVSASLNALQVIHRDAVTEPMQFPQLPSRNTTVRRTSLQLRACMRAHSWQDVRLGFYTDYLELCKIAATRLKALSGPMPIYAVEMALFAHTEELLDLAFPR
jgi:hypothetical protein